MNIIETPEQRWGLREKPLHRTGEVSETEYLERLNSNDRSCLKKLFHHLQSVASSKNTQTHILAVGSSANLHSEYGDIDLLICPEDKKVRSEFIEQVSDRLKSDEHLITQQQYPKGSALSFHTPYTPFKLFVSPAPTVDMQEIPKVFDMTFLGKEGEDFTETLSFHRQNNLAFSILKKIQ